MKKGKVLAIVISAVVLVAAGFYFVGNKYYSDSRIIKEQWHLTLPGDAKKQYYISSQGALGDGSTYTVYQSKDISFLGKMSSLKNTKMQNSISEILRNLHVDSDKYPNFSHPYEWKILSMKDDNRNKLYAVYDTQASLLYLVQDLY